MPGPLDPNQQQMNPQAMFQAAMQPPPQPTGIAGILSNPLVQGALASYLGAIGSPRSMGWGGAISRGGLMGLGTLDEAQRMQQGQQSQRLKMAEDAARLGIDSRKADIEQGKADTYKTAMQRYGALGPERAARLWQTMPPEIQREFNSPDVIAGMTEQNFTKMLDDARNRLQRAPLIGAQTAAAQAHRQQELASAGAVPSLVAERNAMTKSMSAAPPAWATGAGTPAPAAAASAAAPPELEAMPDGSHTTVGGATYAKDGGRLFRLGPGGWEPMP